MRSSLRSRFALALLILASLVVVGVLIYSQRITNELLARERRTVDLYAKAYEYMTSERSSSGDLSFMFTEIVQTVDFPVIQSDSLNNGVYSRNLGDSLLTDNAKQALWKKTIEEMDKTNKPIPITWNGRILSYVHYGESRLVAELRWLPYVELALAAVFILVAYIGYSYLKRNEQSNIWVGMSKETAHQLGTPLSSLMAWVERLKEHAHGNPDLEETVTEIDRDVERLNKVTARFSKIGSAPSLKEENLNEVIRGVISYIAKRVPKSRNVDLRIDSVEEVHATINRELFEWVIENLMKNALDAMEGPTGSISFALQRQGRRTIIDVTDTGKGIDQKFQKEVFRPGYSTKKRGWGLGLSLARRIIENYHKGRLFVKQSSPGKGTTFRIRLRG